MGNKIFGVPVDGQNEHYFIRDELLFIQNWRKSAKVEIPMFYTIRGRYTVPTSLDLCAAGMPSFQLFQKGCLVNRIMVDRIEHYDYGNIVHFKGTEITTEISDFMYENLDLIYYSEEDRVVIISHEKSGEFRPLGSTYFIDVELTKRDTRIPRLHSAEGEFMVGTTLGVCGDLLDLTLIDSGVYANLDKIKHIETSPFGATATVYFKDADITTTMAGRKVRFFKKIFPVIKK